MTIARIRGEQIRPGILRESHFAPDAQLPESILAINWSNHTEILQNKKVVYKVQLDDLTVGGLTEIDVTTLVTGNPVTSTGNEEGIIVDAPKNKVTFRDGTTMDTPLKDEHGHIVFGRMVYEGGAFKIKFYVDENGVETPYTMPANQTIDAIFYRRGNLLNIPEDFIITDGGNFVEGQTDAIADFNIKQLAKDLGVTLNNKGNMSLSRSVIEEILVQTRGVTNTTVRANTIIDEVVEARNGKASLNAELSAIRQSITDEVNARQAAITAEADARTSAINAEAAARQAADQAIRDDLASTSAGKGASLIGIADANNKFTATTVEGALSELEGRIAGLESGGGAEVTATHTRDAATVNGVFSAGTFASLEARLEDIEGTVDAKVKELQDSVANEATARANADATLQANIDAEVAARQAAIADEVAARQAADDALSARIAALEAVKNKIHVHDRYIFQAVGNETQVMLPEGKKADVNTLVVTINGLEQAVGINYTEINDVNGYALGVDFNPDVLKPGDVVIMKWLNALTA